MKYPKDMDKEIIPLCNALNTFRGVRTLCSCQGHKRKVSGNPTPYISMVVTDMLSMRVIVMVFDKYRPNFNSRWWCEVESEASDGYIRLIVKGKKAGAEVAKLTEFRNLRKILIAEGKIHCCLVK